MELFFQIPNTEAGTDEAGRGCLAGPVVAAAVVWPSHLICPEINDSKALNEKARTELAIFIKQNALAYAIAEVSPTEIDQINILQASIKAMHLALDQISGSFESILVDGNKFKPYKDIPYTTFVKGDSKFMAIAAASILAKTARDQIMQELALEFPEYGWAENKGYPTISHKKAILIHGNTPHHRLTFNSKLTKKQGKQLKIVF